MNKHLTYDEYFEEYNKPTLIYKNYFEQQKELDRLNNKLNKIKKYINSHTRKMVAELGSDKINDKKCFIFV